MCIRDRFRTKQVRFININNMFIGPAQKTRLETPLPFADSVFHVNAAEQHILGHIQRQCKDPALTGQLRRSANQH